MDLDQAVFARFVSGGRRCIPADTSCAPRWHVSMFILYIKSNILMHGHKKRNKKSKSELEPAILRQKLMVVVAGPTLECIVRILGPQLAMQSSPESMCVHTKTIGTQSHVRYYIIIVLRTVDQEGTGLGFRAPMAQGRARHMTPSPENAGGDQRISSSSTTPRSRSRQSCVLSSP